MTATTQPPAEVDETEVLSLVVDRSSVEPGGSVVATGRGCDPDHAVELAFEGDVVGTARADARGDFSVPVDVPLLDPGRHLLDADCGSRLTTSIDVVLATNSDDSGSTAALVLLFLLVALSLSRLRRSLITGERHVDR